MIEFTKMHGLGNDFVVIDARSQPLDLSAEETRRIADRRYGVGCDQVIVLGPSAQGEAFMRIYNPDGSEVAACGNATRCVGQRLLAETDRALVRIETRAGLLEAQTSPAGVTVNMGPARLDAAVIPLARHDVDTRAVPLATEQLGARLPATFSAVNMGNPHAIFFVDDVDAHELERIGPLLEHDAMFPERANISLVAQIGPDHLRQRVWERGAGLTLACGSGACAAAVAAHRAGLTGRKVTVSLPGGDLLIEWRADGDVLMTGGVATAFSGVFAPAVLAR